MFLLSSSCDKDNGLTNKPRTSGRFYIKADMSNYSGSYVQYNASVPDNGFLPVNEIQKKTDAVNKVHHINYWASIEQDSTSKSFTSAVTSKIKIGFNGLVFNSTEFDSNPAEFHTKMSDFPAVFLDSSNNINTGVEITLLDENGQFWSSKYGPQSYSFITITENKQAPLDFYSKGPAQLITGTFSCTLYQKDNVNSYQMIYGGTFYVMVKRD